jgi:hypothetical protein
MRCGEKTTTAGGQVAAYFRFPGMHTRDTSANAEAVEDEIHRARAAEQSRMGVREGWPEGKASEYTEGQLHRELAHTLFGRKSR